MILNQKPFLQFIFAFLVTTTYIPGIIGAAIPTNWFVLIIVAPIAFFFCSISKNINSHLIFIFFIYVCSSFYWTQNINIAIFHFFQIISLICVFYIGENLDDLRPTFMGLAAGLSISGIIAIAQLSGYTPVYALYSNITGLFVNPNIYSEVTIVVLIGLIVLKLWWWIPLTLPGIVLVHSRTALAAFGIGLFLMLFKKNKSYAIVAITVVILISLYLYRHSFNTLSIEERINLYKDTINGFTFFGHGVGSFEILYPYYATHVDTALARPRFAHNDWLQLIFEFGIFALIPMLIALNLMRHNNAILWAIGIISLFTFPFHVPVIAFIGCLVAGYLNNNNGTICYYRNSRGSNLSQRGA